LRFIFLQTPVISYGFYSSVTVTAKEKGGKPDRKPYPLPYGLRNPYRNLKSENSQDHAQKSQRNCTFMNSASGKDRPWDGCQSYTICGFFNISIVVHTVD